jgi:hypothetical protein
MYPHTMRGPDHDRTVDEIAGYPIGAAMQKQMIERAKNDGTTYAAVIDAVRKIIQQHGADSTTTDAELEIYLARRGPQPNEPGLKRTKRKPRAAFDDSAIVTRERVLPDRSH